MLGLALVFLFAWTTSSTGQIADEDGLAGIYDASDAEGIWTSVAIADAKLGTSVPTASGGSGSGSPVVLVGIQPHTCAPVLSEGGRGGSGVPLDLAFSDSTSNCLSFSALPPPAPGEQGPDPATLTPEEMAAIAADRAMALAARPQLEVAPASVGLTGLPSFFWLAEEPGTVSATAVVPGMEVTAEATPVRYVWTSGDGARFDTRGHGRPWRRNRPGNIAHTYERRGRYDLEVTVIWYARWRIGSSPWNDLGYFANSDSTSYPVRQVRPVLKGSRS